MARSNVVTSMKAFAAVLLCVVTQGFPADAPGSDTDNFSMENPGLHHILIEVSDVNRSLRFYHDCLGLEITSRSDDFVTLESANAGIYLWRKHWGWEKARTKGERNGCGMYPHFDFTDVAAVIDRCKAAGYAIIQEPIAYDWGKEAFVQDPDGYIIALVTMAKAK